jgi:uncharacterized membrane protein YphA (DoxX/SURF4 family)
MFLTSVVRAPFWQSWGLLLARLIVAGLFFMAAWFKFSDIDTTAGYIASIGFPMPVFFAWVAALLEMFIGLAFLSGVLMRELALVALVYIIFLAFAFHGPSHWAANQYEYGSFVDHFTFAAGLIYMLVFGPGPLVYSGTRLSQD